MSIPMTYRYERAYKVARATMKTARILRFFGIVAAVIVLIIGLALSMNNGAVAAVGAVIAVLIVLVSLAFYTFLAAQAHMMAATLDTAINTSSFFDASQKAEMLEELELER